MKTGLTLEHVYFQYNNINESHQKYILEDVCLNIEKGEYVAVIGQTGSGKSTLLQHLNGLLEPTFGTCLYHGEDIHSKGYSLKDHRLKVSLCFQYPEYQLFEETVLKDICFGPANQGLNKEECEQKAKKAMALLGLSEDLLDVSPFMLSGGQKRKVALAGILAMEPEVLILDEPAAGLDYESKEKLFNLLEDLNKNQNMTIILVSHDMDDVARYAKRVIIMKEGRVLKDGTTGNVLGEKETMQEAGLGMPHAAAFYHRLMENKGRKQGKNVLERDVIPITPDQLAEFIAGELL